MDKKTIRFAKELADPNFCLSVPDVAKDVIKALVEEIEGRTLTKEEQLHALPSCSIVRDRDGYVYEKDGNTWLSTDKDDQWATEFIHFPVKVLYYGNE